MSLRPTKTTNLRSGLSTRTTMQQRRSGLPLLLLALLVLPAAHAGMLDAFMDGLVPQQQHAAAAPATSLELEAEPLCANTFLACQAACSELKLKAEHHAPLPTTAVVVAAYWAVLVVALAVAAVWSAQSAVAAHAALREAQADFEAREAQLQMQIQGIKEQAYDLGRRAARGANSRPGSRASRPSSRQAGSRITSPSAGPPQQHAGGGAPSPSASTQGNQGTAQQAYASLPPPVLASPPTSATAASAPALAAEPSASGFSMLVSEASLNADTTGPAASDQQPAPAGAAKGSPAKGMHPAYSGAHQQQQQGEVVVGSSPAGTPTSYAQQHLEQYASTPPSGALYAAEASPGHGSVGGLPVLPGASPAVSGAAAAYYGAPQYTPDSSSSRALSQHAADQAAAQQVGSPAGHAWVTTSRGGGIPPAMFDAAAAAAGAPPTTGFSPLQRSPLGVPPGMFTPTSGSTTRSAGTNVHSIAGSCGGSVNHFNSSSRLGPAGHQLSPPSSVTSAASGRTVGSSRGLTPPGGAIAHQTQEVFSRLDALLTATAEKRRAAEARRDKAERIHGSPRKAGSSCSLTPGSSTGRQGASPALAPSASPAAPPRDAPAPSASPAGSASSYDLRASMV